MVRTSARASSLPADTLVDTAKTMMCSPTTCATARRMSSGQRARGTLTKRWYSSRLVSGERSITLCTPETAGWAASHRLRSYAWPTRAASSGEPVRWLTTTMTGATWLPRTPAAAAPRHGAPPPTAGARKHRPRRAGDAGRGAQEKQERRHGHEHPPWMGHDEGGEAMPESGSSIHAGGTEAGERQSIHAGTQQGQGGREKGQPIHDREDDDQGAREPQRADIPQPEHEHAEETDGHRHPREEDGPPGGGHGDGEGVGDRAAGDLFPEAAHDEERVVDGDAEADHGHDVRRVGRHRHVASEDLRSRDAPVMASSPTPRGRRAATTERKARRRKSATTGRMIISAR